MSPGERTLTREDVGALRPAPVMEPAPASHEAGARRWGELRARDVLGLQRRAGNQAVARALARVRRRQIQRYTDEQLQQAVTNLKLPSEKVQSMLETGEATGLFSEVMEAANSPLVLNPDGLSTMLGSFRAVMPKKEKAKSTTESSTASTAAPGGAAGFVRELLYGLQHIRSGRYVQFGAMAPDDLSEALARVGLKDEAAMVKEGSKSVALGQHLGGDVVVWGSGKEKVATVPETVQHKVVDGEDETAVANELRNAIHQLAGKNKELAILGSRRIADIVVLPANKLANAGWEKFVQVIESRMDAEFGGKKLSAYVDMVRISATAYRVEYDVKSHRTTTVQYAKDDSTESTTLTEKTPRQWNEEAIVRPESVRPKPKVVEKKVAEMTGSELTKHIDGIEMAKAFEDMNKSDATHVADKLEYVKKEWLKTKTDNLSKEKVLLINEREEWVKDQLSKDKPPEKQEERTQWSKDQQKKGGLLRQQWTTQHKKELDDIDLKITQIEARILEDHNEDAELLQRLNSAILKHKTLANDIVRFGNAAKERNDWVSRQPPEKKSQEELVKLQQQWDEENPELASLVVRNQKYAKMNEASIKRDREIKREKLEERQRQEERVKKVCGLLLKAVATVLPRNDPTDFLTSLIAVLEQARHEAGVGLLCGQLATELLRAHEHAKADIPAIEPKGLAAFTQTLCTHKDFNNLQGDLGEIAQAVRMAESTARTGPVIIGSTDYDKDKPKNQKAQEIDISFAGKDQDKDVLNLQEVAFNLEMLERKLLTSEKASQREGYTRVIQAQRNASSREVRMTYVVHNAGPEDLHAIRTNVAPKTLGTDLSDIVNVGDAGAMKTVLVKRGYYLSLGGKVYAPSDL